MKDESSSSKFAIATLIVTLLGTIGTVTTSVIALCLQHNSSKAANEIASKSVKVAELGTQLQLTLDRINQERKEPKLSMLRAGGSRTEFVYTVQNLGEKDAVILDFSITTIDDRDKNAANNNSFVGSKLISNVGFENRIDLSKLPYSLRYELGTPLVVGPGKVVRIILEVAHDIPYGVIHATYNAFEHLELSHTHINRGQFE